MAGGIRGSITAAKPALVNKSVTATTARLNFPVTRFGLVILSEVLHFGKVQLRISGVQEPQATDSREGMTNL